MMRRPPRRELTWQSVHRVASTSPGMTAKGPASSPVPWSSHAGNPADARLLLHVERKATARNGPAAAPLHIGHGFEKSWRLPAWRGSPDSAWKLLADVRARCARAGESILP